jgi:ABC-type amino acid transport substrate-binding protein
MDDERIEHALKLGPVDEPAYHAGIRARIGSTASSTPSEGPPMASSDGPALSSPVRIDVHRPVGVGTSRAPRLATMAQLAAVLAIVVVVAAVAVPGLVGRPRASDNPAPSSDMLDRLRASGSLRMVVPAGPPQIVSVGGVRIGFDIDVARALAEQLSLEPDVMPVDAVPDLPSSAWDVSVGMPQDGGVTGESEPFAHWPAWLATSRTSGIRTLDDLAGHPICIVESTVAEDWLDGLPPDPAAPSGPTVVRTKSDDECIAALGEGRVDALVTSTLFDDELDAHGLVAVGTEPVAYEPRVVLISATGEDAERLLAAIDGAIDELRASGRLAELSRQSFGGRDLTEVKP